MSDITVTMPLERYEKLIANQRLENYDDDLDQEVLKANIKYLNQLVKEAANGELESPEDFELFKSDFGRVILSNLRLFK